MGRVQLRAGHGYRILKRLHRFAFFTTDFYVYEVAKIPSSAGVMSHGRCMAVEARQRLSVEERAVHDWT